MSVHFLIKLTIDAERASWMRNCVSIAVSQPNTDGDAAFAHCLKWRAWYDKHDEEGWR